MKSMIEYIQHYYAGEKTVAVPAFIAGIFFLLTGGFLLFKFSYNPLSKGIGTGFLIMTFLFFLLGISSFIYNNKKLEHLKEISMVSEHQLQQMEIERMEKVMKVTFPYAFLTMGILMAIGFAIVLMAKDYYWKGIGISLMVLMLLAVVADNFSMQGNAQYQEDIKKYKVVNPV